MPQRQFEYRIAQTQLNRVTFVDGKWAGRVAPTDPGAAESCEEVSVWLRKEGWEGWELVSATVESASGQNLTRLYLKRELGTRG